MRNSGNWFHIVGFLMRLLMMFRGRLGQFLGASLGRLNRGQPNGLSQVDALEEGGAFSDLMAGLSLRERDLDLRCGFRGGSIHGIAGLERHGSTGIDLRERYVRE
jgi:hypothetical protein